MSKIFFRGLVVVLPLFITIALVVWALDMVERGFGMVTRLLIGENLYFPGLGLIIGLIVILIVGSLMNALIVQKFYDWTERMMQRIPFVKSLYGSIKDLMNFFSSKNQTQGKVVTIEIGGTKLLGFITRESFDDLPPEVGKVGDVAVYLPMSYQIGGYTVIVPKDKITFVDMTIESAMRFSVTAGMSGKKDEFKS